MTAGFLDPLGELDELSALGLFDAGLWGPGSGGGRIAPTDPLPGGHLLPGFWDCWRDWLLQGGSGLIWDDHPCDEFVIEGPNLVDPSKVDSDTIIPPIPALPCGVELCDWPVALGPQDNAGGFNDFWEIDPAQYSDSLRLGNRISAWPCFGELLQWAWALLNRNISLVEWATCSVGWGDCVGNKIRSGVRVNFSWVACSKDKMAVAFPHFGISICDDHERVEALGYAWCCGNDVDRICAAMRAASLLAHEICHLCYHGEPGSGECGGAYLVGNLVLWGLVQRYPIAVLESNCCNTLGDYLLGWDYGSFTPSCTRDCE